MNADQLRQELSRDREHALSGQRIVAVQKDRVAKHRAGGHSVKSHEQLLGQFEATLALLEQHERILMAEVEEAENPPKRTT